MDEKLIQVRCGFIELLKLRSDVIDGGPEQFIEYIKNKSNLISLRILALQILLDRSEYTEEIPEGLQVLTTRKGHKFAWSMVDNNVECWTIRKVKEERYK